MPLSLKLKTPSKRHIDAKILSRINHLDLTGRVKRKSEIATTSGGQADVFEGHCQTKDRGSIHVAMKRLRLHVKDNASAEAFEKEAYVWSKLNHQNVLELLGYLFCKDTGYPILISEWMEHGSAWTYVQLHPQLSLEGRMGLLVDIAKGLSYLHGEGCVHSDLKSDNVLIDSRGHAVISDFGSARMMNYTCSIAKLTSQGRGTAVYWAPELFDIGEEKPSQLTEADIWAFGMELATGRRPFAGPEIQVLRAIMLGQTPEWTAGDATLEGLKKIAQACWARDQSSRPRARDLVDELPAVVAFVSYFSSEGNTHSKHLSLSRYMDDRGLRAIPQVKRGPGWFAMLNPELNEALDINLVSTFNQLRDVWCLHFSPNGNLLAVGGDSSTRIYSTVSSELVCELDDKTSPHWSRLTRALCFSPDGALLATGHEEGGIRIWDISEQRVRKTLEGHIATVASLVFSKDGAYLVSGTRGGTIRTWNVATGTCNRLPEAPGHFEAEVTTVAISPDGSTLAAGFASGSLRLWDIRSGYLIQRISCHNSSVESIAFTADGKRIVSASVDKTLKRWDISGLLDRVEAWRAGGEKNSALLLEHGCETVMTFAGHKDLVNAVAISRDGRWTVSGSADGGVHFWDSETGQVQLRLEGHTRTQVPFPIDLALTCGMLATSREDKVRLWRFNPPSI